MESLKDAIDREKILDRELVKYAGQYVAVTNHKVIDYDLSLEALVKRVGPEPVCSYVPMPPNTFYV